MCRSWDSSCALLEGSLTADADSGIDSMTVRGHFSWARLQHIVTGGNLYTDTIGTRRTNLRIVFSGVTNAVGFDGELWLLGWSVM